MLIKKLKYRVLRLLLKTIGKLSNGIRLGWRTGFDSGVMLEYVYENKPRGITPVGVLFDRMYLSNPVWDGVRSRRLLLVQQIKEAIACYNHPQVFDLAAGMGSYLFLLPFDHATIIAGDYEPEAVAKGQEKADKLGRSDITFKQNNAFNLEAFATGQADILICSGFFDILTQDQQIQTVLQNGSAIAKPGACWIFTIQEYHPDLTLLRESLIDLNRKPWELVPRPAYQLVEWAKLYGWKLEKLQRNEYFAIGTLVKI